MVALTLSATTLIAGSAFAATPQAAPTPNGTWAYKANAGILGTYSGTYAVNQFKYNASSKCWNATIVYNKGGNNVKGSLMACGGKGTLTGSVKGTTILGALTAKVVGKVDAKFTKLSAKVTDNLSITVTATATKSGQPMIISSGSSKDAQLAAILSEALGF